MLCCLTSRCITSCTNVSYTALTHHILVAQNKNCGGYCESTINEMECAVLRIHDATQISSMKAILENANQFKNPHGRVHELTERWENVFSRVC